MRETPAIEVAWVEMDSPACGAECSLCGKAIEAGGGIVLKLRSGKRHEVRAARLHHQCVAELFSAVKSKYEEFQAVARQAIDDAAQPSVLGQA